MPGVTLEDVPFRLVFRYLRSCAMAVGLDPEKIDAADGFDLVWNAMHAPTSPVCALSDFLPAIFKRNKPGLSAAIKINPGQRNYITRVQSAEQFIGLARSGFAVDLREKK